ncbi:hypothetical protein Smp_017980 [Schistosoma mansoni]|uniref:hypothetical protein n=1 Tax=Schistosoma mansoni TaxID=6183 RepID=UPI00022DC9BF|nr:hypothetical protein Smp_017980 [Schistosoma mansoni]|eukprot:XP_018654866.1 hypothetical protein Smp_017980 [Schistosoma mansoni]
MRPCLGGRSVINSSPSSSVKLDRFSKSTTSGHPSDELTILLVGLSYASPTNLTKSCCQHLSIWEIFETIRTAMAIHKHLVNLSDLNEDTGDNGKRLI